MLFILLSTKTDHLHLLRGQEHCVSLVLALVPFIILTTLIVTSIRQITVNLDNLVERGYVKISDKSGIHLLIQVLALPLFPWLELTNNLFKSPKTFSFKSATSIFDEQK